MKTIIKVAILFFALFSLTLSAKEITYIDFSNKIKAAANEQNISKLYSFFNGDLENAPKRADIKGKKFSEIFPDGWAKDVYSGEVSKVGLKGYMIADGLVWFDNINSKWQIIAFNGWNKNLAKSESNLSK